MMTEQTHYEALKAHLEQLTALGIKGLSFNPSQREEWCEAVLQAIPKNIDHPIVLELLRILDGKFWVRPNLWSFETKSNGPTMESYALTLTHWLGGQAFIDIKTLRIRISIVPKIVAENELFVSGQESFATRVHRATKHMAKQLRDNTRLTAAMAKPSIARKALETHLSTPPESPEQEFLWLHTPDGHFVRHGTGLAGIVKWVSRRHTPLLSMPGRKRINCRHYNPEIVYRSGHSLNKLIPKAHQRKAYTALEGSTYWIETPESEIWLQTACALAKTFEQTHKTIWVHIERRLGKNWVRRLCLNVGIDKRHAERVHKIVWERLVDQFPYLQDYFDKKIDWPEQWLAWHEVWLAKPVETTVFYPTATKIDAALEEERYNV